MHKSVGAIIKNKNGEIKKQDNLRLFTAERSIETNRMYYKFH